MLRGLFKAITRGHDGSSPEQSYTVMSVAEEYAVCRLAGWSVKGQALVGKEGKMYDQLTVEDREGTEFSVYFDTSSFFGKF